MRFRTRMIATTAAVALLVPPFLFAAEDSTNSSARATAVDSAVTPDAVGNAEVPAALASAQSRHLQAAPTGVILGQSFFWATHIYGVCRR